MSTCLDWHFAKVTPAVDGDWIGGASALGECHGRLVKEVVKRSGWMHFQGIFSVSGHMPTAEDAMNRITG